MNEHPTLPARRHSWPRLLAAIALLALVLRWLWLGHASLWIDEAWSLRVAQMTPGEILLFDRTDTNPPLYYLLLHYWGALGDNEAVLRFLSVLLGTAAVVISTQSAYEWFGLRVAAISGLLMALSSLLIDWSRQIRMYGLLQFCTALALWGLWQIVAAHTTRRRRWGMAAYILGMVGALYTQSAIPLFWGAILLWGALMTLWRRPWPCRRRFWLAQLAVACCWLPYFPSRFATIGTVVDHFWIPPVTLRYITASLSRQFLGHQPWVPWWPLLVGFPIFVLFCAGVWRARRQPTLLALLLLVIVVPQLILLVVSLWRPLWGERYVIYVTPLLLMLVANGLTAERNAWAWLRVKAPRLVGANQEAFVLAATAAAIAAMASGTIFLFAGLQRDDWRAVAQFVIPQLQPGDQIDISDSGALSFHYYYEKMIDPALATTLSYSPTMITRGQIIEPAGNGGSASPATASVLPAGTRRWLIDSVARRERENSGAGAPSSDGARELAVFPNGIVIKLLD